MAKVSGKHARAQGNNRERQLAEPDKIAQDLQKAVLAGYSEKLQNEFLSPKNIGRMADPDSYVRITGVCGDTVEMFLAIENSRISDVKFVTDGCGVTIACVSYVTRTAKGKSVEEALRIESQGVDEYFGGLPGEHKHCARLAVMTLVAALETYQGELSK